MASVSCTFCRKSRLQAGFCLFYLFVILGIVASSKNSLRKCAKGGREWNSATLRDGALAGDFSILKRTTSMTTCKELCCANDSCELALLVNGGCFSVQCTSAEACMPHSVKRDGVVAPRIFVRNIAKFLKKRQPESTNVGESDSNKELIREKSTNVGESDSNKELIREKRQASCHHYHGHVCSEHLDKNKLLYIKKSPKILEESLRSPFSLLKPRLLKDCAKYALKAICLTTYPYCPSTNKPKPVRLCREECEELQSGVCESDFRVARQFDYLAVILPNCSALPEKGSKEAEGCIKLGITESIKQDQSNSLDVNNSKDFKGLVTHGDGNDADDKNTDDHESKATAAAPITQSTQKPSSKRHSDIDMAKMMPSMAAVMPSKEAVVTGEKAVNNESFPQATSGDKNWQQSQLSSALEDITPQDVPSISAQGKVNNIERVVPSPSNSTSPASSLQHSPITEPTVVNITNTTEVNLAQSSENASSTTPPAVTLKPAFTNQSETNLVTDTITTGPSTEPAPEVPHKSLEVSAGDNKVLTLPVNTVSLYASAWPKETSENPYSYHWQQISAPEGSHGYMEGQDSRRVILSQTWR